MKVEFEQIILGQIYSRNNPYEQKITCRVFQRIVHIQIVTRASIALLLHLALHFILLDQFHVALKDHSELH